MLIPKKSLGQNFLTDAKSVVKMVDALGISGDSGDVVYIEIGPGLGIVTEELRRKIGEKTLHIIELDNRAVEILKGKFGTVKNIHIVSGNVLDWLPLTTETNFKIIGSLPYYITSPIIHAIIKLETPPEACVFLVQKEVAKKISASVHDASYLSVFVQTFFDVKYLGVVEKTKFSPVPKVDGGILQLKRKVDCPIPHAEKKKYEGFLHKGFSNPRKMLNKVFEKDFLEKHRISPNLRPQDLTVGEWTTLFRDSN